MKTKLMTLALLLALRPLAADPQPALVLTNTPGTAAVVTPQPTATPNLTPVSNPPVTPDPRFKDPNYLGKWPHIDLAEAQRLMKKKGVVFADGRSQSEWDQSHIPGALPLPLNDFGKGYTAAEPKLKKAKIILAYCHGEGCHLSDSLAQNLVDKGFKNVAVFWGGFPAWTAAHLPLEDKYGRTLPQTPVPTPVPTTAPVQEPTAVTKTVSVTEPTATTSPAPAGK